MTDYSKWPLSEWERRFYREESVLDLKFLVPNYKLGEGKIDKADRAQLSAAKDILRADKNLLLSLRQDQVKSAKASVDITKQLIEESKDERERHRLTAALIQLVSDSRVSESEEPTDDDAQGYIRLHRYETPIHCPWIAALYIPLGDCPPISELYRYIPRHILLETQRFFGESVNALQEKLNETTESSNESNTEGMASP